MNDDFNREQLDENGFRQAPPTKEYKEYTDDSYQNSTYEEPVREPVYEAPKQEYSNNANQPYGQAYNQYQAPESTGFAIASLVLGIIAMITSCLGINIIFAVISIILGAIHLAKRDTRRGMAIAGIILSVISIVIFIALVALGLYLFANGLGSDSEEIINEIIKGL